MIDLNKITGFNWDDGNARKNDKPSVSMAEAEQVFFNAPLLVLDDVVHSQSEPRLHALGVTDDGRTLHITFTLRQTGQFIRVISARDMHRKGSAIYEQAV
jgi:uncharacterized DUF497 family protein